HAATGRRTPRRQLRQRRAHTGGLPRGHQRRGRGPRVRRPADRGWPPGVRARPHPAAYVVLARPGLTLELARPDHPPVAPWKTPWASLDDEVADRDPDLDRVLTLRRLMETVAAADRPIDLAIETKHPTRYGGLVERRLVEALAEFGWTGPDSPVRVMSFSYVALQRMQRLAPDLQLVMLIERARQWPVLKPVLEDGWALGPGLLTLAKHPKFADRLVRTGRDLHVWTVNTRTELDLCLSLGVRAVITDRPRQMLGWLGEP